MTLAIRTLADRGAFPALLSTTLLALATIVPADGEIPTHLLSSDGDIGDAFGIVAIHGTTALIGAFDDDDNGNGAGAAYVFDTVTGQEVHKLLASDGASNDGFGIAVAIHGSTALVGAFLADGAGNNRGAAYVFDTDTGQELFKLTPNNASDSDTFGRAVAVEGSIGVIGASRSLNPMESGSAYVFDMQTGQQLFELSPVGSNSNDWFGSSVSISGNLALIGAQNSDENGQSSGSAYLFDVTTGTLAMKLLPGDGAIGDLFGASVSIDGDFALIGAPGDSPFGIGSGSAYLFNSANGLLRTKIIPSEGFPGDNFGESVAISGTLALISSPEYDDDTRAIPYIDAGRVHVYEALEAQVITTLLSTEPDQIDRYGLFVAISGTNVLIGEPIGEFNGQDFGMVDLYRFDGGTVAARNGSGLNANILTNVTPPLIGTTWETDLDTAGHSPFICGIGVFPEPYDGLFTTGGELLIDVTSVELSRVVVPHGGQVVRLSIAIPSDLALCGAPFSAQGVVFGSPGYELSNALDGIIGL